MVKKLVAIVLSLCILIGLLSGCGGTAGKSSMEESTKPAANEELNAKEKLVEKTKVKVWSNLSGSGDLHKKLVEKYNAENKDNIQIDMTIYTDQYDKLLSTAIATGEVPDMFLLPNILDTTKYSKSNTIEPLDSYLPADYMGQFVDGAFAERLALVGGKIYAVPYAAFSFKLVYNKDLFKKAGLDPNSPPKTWAQVIDYAKKITSVGENKQYGFGLPFGESNWITDIYVHIAFMNSGIPFRGYDWKQGKYDFTVYKPAIEVYKTLLKDGSVFPGAATLKNDPARAQFSEGNIGMMAAASWDVGVFNDQFPAKIDWGVADFPTLDGTVKGKTRYAIGGGWVVSASSKVKAEAVKVLQFFNSEEFLGESFKEGKGIFLRKGLTDKYKSTKKGMDGFMPGSVDSAMPEIPMDQLDLKGLSIFTDMGDMILFDEKDIDKTLKEDTEIFNAALEKAISEGKYTKEDTVIADYDLMNPGK